MRHKIFCKLERQAVKAFAFLVILTLAGPAQMTNAGTLPSQKTLWQGQSDGFTIKCTPSDIAVSRDGRLVYSARNEMAKVAKKMAEGLDGLNIEESVELLSVVGPYMSIRYSEMDVPLGKDGMIASAHPGGQTAFITIDLRKPGTPILQRAGFATEKGSPELQQLLGEQNVFDALSKDKVMRASFPVAAMNSFASLKRALSEDSVSLQGDNLCGQFDDNFLNSFTFQHVDGDKVAVRMGVSGAGPCRYNLTEIGVLVPIPSNLKPAFNDAAAKTSGILRHDLPKIEPAKYEVKSKP